MLQTTLSSLKKNSKERKKLVKSLNEELSRLDHRSTQNPAVISEYMKDITYIKQLADSLNPAELNEALMSLGFPMIDSRNPAVIDEQRILLYSYLIAKTISGNPITLNILGNLTPEVTGLKVTMNPIQDLHGYSNPWVGGAGKNKLPMTLAGIKSANTSGTWSGNAYTVNGVTFTINTDSDDNVLGITANNKASSTAILILAENFSAFSADVILNGCPSGGSNSTYRVDYNGGTGADMGSSVTITAGTSFTNARIRIASGYSASNVKFYPMIRLATVTDTTFAPYSNICPISGRTEASVTRTAGEDVETKTHQYSETIYGGTDDFVNGGLSNEWGYIAEYDGETLPGEWISDRDTYVPETTPTTGAEVAYKLATPTTISTSAEEITLLKGENVIYTDGDSIEITYKQNFT